MSSKLSAVLLFTVADLPHPSTTGAISFFLTHILTPPTENPGSGPDLPNLAFLQYIYNNTVTSCQILISKYDFSV